MKLTKKDRKETKIWFFEKIKLIKYLARLKKKRRGSKSIRNETGELITEITETQMILRHYYKPQYVNRMDNQKEMGKLLERCRQNQEKTENINGPIKTTKIEFVI